jgi:hypothetical protein
MGLMIHQNAKELQALHVSRVSHPGDLWPLPDLFLQPETLNLGRVICRLIRLARYCGNDGSGEYHTSLCLCISPGQLKTQWMVLCPRTLTKISVEG